MIDVLLTHSNHLFYDRKQAQKMQPYPPLQTLLGAAVLRESAFSVSVCDVTLNDPEQKLERYLQVLAPRLVVVCEDDFNFLTKMCLVRNRELAFWTAQLAKRLGCRTAAHGSDASDHVKEYLDAGFDCVLVGEVEDTLRELSAQHPPESIAGLAYRCPGTGHVQYNARRKVRSDLDVLPLPAWDLIDMHPYREKWLAQHGFFSLNMVSSRGCPYRCNWCAKPIYGNNYHVRSPRRVAEEMLHLKRTYRPDHIWFADDIFALSGRWTAEFSTAVETLGAQIPFKMQSRCDLMTRDTVAALKRAGCCEIWMGAESGSQRVLDAMDKGTRVEHIYQARANLARHGIRAGWFLQFGYPSEAWEDIEATVRMVRETKPHDIGISVSYPLPGTKFYQLVSSQMGKKTNWSDSGDLAMMFGGAYSSDMYRALADALHLEVREPEKKTAIQNAWSRVYELRNGAVSAIGVA
ncbi:MAG: B12-binding domain-containing radical SAM protein [Acidobacteriaceae bacterium]|nr:B12-binding domain-containing radical SAM protein [Acidobacteriaceae bacterium]